MKRYDELSDAELERLERRAQNIARLRMQRRLRERARPIMVSRDDTQSQQSQ